MQVGRQDWFSPSFTSSTSQCYIPQTAFVVTSKVTFWIASYFSLPNLLLVSSTFSLNLITTIISSASTKISKAQNIKALSYSTLFPPLSFLVLHLYHNCYIKMVVPSYFQWASHSRLTRVVCLSSSLVRNPQSWGTIQGLIKSVASIVSNHLLESNQVELFGW